jgi:hypothetical protein
MSRTHKIIEAHKRNRGEPNMFDNIENIHNIDAGLRFGNQRKSIAKAKVIARRQERRKNKEISIEE